jgi:hypothetical protein
VFLNWRAADQQGQTVPPSLVWSKAAFVGASIGKTKKKFTNFIKIEELKVALTDRNAKLTLNE